MTDTSEDTESDATTDAESGKTASADDDEPVDGGTSPVSAAETENEEAFGTGPARTRPGHDEVFCRDCGAVINEDAEICPTCGLRQRDRPGNSVESLLNDLTEGGNPFVAAAFSVLLPGLGQIYNRELQKGIAVIVASLIALASVVAFVGIVLYPAVWLYAIYDAYNVAERQSDNAE